MDAIERGRYISRPLPIFRSRPKPLMGHKAWRTYKGNVRRLRGEARRRFAAQASNPSRRLPR